MWIKLPETQGLFDRSFAGRAGQKHVITFANVPSSNKWELLSGKAHTITYEADAVHVIGDPTNPDYDIAELAEQIKREEPQLRGRKFVLANPFDMDCQSMTSGPFGFRSTLIRCNLP